jgi:hypothetical protein
MIGGLSMLRAGYVRVMNDHHTTDPDDPTPDPRNQDPRNQEVDGDEGMPAEFIDTPANRPGDQSPPTPGTDDDG